MRPSTVLRRMLEEPEIVVLPGAYDALPARLAERAGFRAVFTTGFGFAATVLGMPDLGLLTMTETMERVRHVVRTLTVPLVADMDTGYGNALNVVRTVRECVALGVAGTWEPAPPPHPRQPIGLEEAIRRGRRYREAGPDVVFVEAPRSVDELR